MINYLAGFSNFMTCCYDEAALKSAKIEYIMVVRNFVPISKRNTRNQLKFDSMTSILNNKTQSEFRCRTYNCCFKITKIYSAFFLAKQQQTLTLGNSTSKFKTTYLENNEIKFRVYLNQWPMHPFIFVNCQIQLTFYKLPRDKITYLQIRDQLFCCEMACTTTAVEEQHF